MAGTVSLPCSSEAGAQSHLTDALSVRLARYEAADAAAPPRPARPSTRGGSRDGQGRWGRGGGQGMWRNQNGPEPRNRLVEVVSGPHRC